MNRIGWNFPPTGGGVETGINDAGIVHVRRGTAVQSSSRDHAELARCTRRRGAARSHHFRVTGD